MSHYQNDDIGYGVICHLVKGSAQMTTYKLQNLSSNTTEGSTEWKCSIHGREKPKKKLMINKYYTKHCECNYIYQQTHIKLQHYKLPTYINSTTRFGGCSPKHVANLYCYNFMWVS